MRAIYFIAILTLFSCNKFFNQSVPEPIISQGKSNFKIAHITDIHIGEGRLDFSGKGFDDILLKDTEEQYPEIRLRKAVESINAMADISFVIVSGDLTDSGEMSEFLKAKEILDLLHVPYIPLIGNHDVWPYTRSLESSIPNGDVFLNQVFENNFQTLSQSFSDFTDLRLQPSTSKEGHTMYLQNFAFTYQNHRFVFADFGTRKHAGKGEPGVGPGAEVFDHVGCTFPFLKNELQKAQSQDLKVVITAHFPLVYNAYSFHYGFNRKEYQKITALLYDYRNIFQYWFCGHWHRNKITPITLIGETELIGLNIETKANKDHDMPSVRVVELFYK